MAGELILPPTGNDLIDSLRGLQLVADQIDDPDRKIAHIKTAIGVIAAGQLIGKQMMVEAATIFARDPDHDPNERILFREGMLFIASLSVFSYMLDQDIPVDSLTLQFVSPDVLGVMPEEAPNFKALTFQVPILSIDSCMLAEVA